MTSSAVVPSARFSTLTITRLLDAPMMLTLSFCSTPTIGLMSSLLCGPLPSAAFRPDWTSLPRSTGLFAPLAGADTDRPLEGSNSTPELELFGLTGGVEPKPYSWVEDEDEDGRSSLP